MLQCLAALIKPFGGSIGIAGIDVLKNPRDAHRIMGFLPDFFGLYDNLTVAKSLEYACLSHGISQSQVDALTDQTLERVGLRAKKEEKVLSLSRGMRQRLAIGQTIIHQPKVLILDEPASGLDPEARSSLSELFLELNREGITLLVSSHILAELDQYASNLLSIRNGKIAAHTHSQENFIIKRKLIFKLVDKPVDADLMLKEKLGDFNFQTNENIISLDFEGDEHQQAKLLEDILKLGFKVSEFYHKKDSLQDKYIDSLKQPQS